jgi:hypothetical protein
MRDYMIHIEEGFALLTDADLARQIPTVFVPEGEALLTLLLGNLEHFINHKYQLFAYLKCSACRSAPAISTSFAGANRLSSWDGKKGPDHLATASYLE